MRSIVAKFPQDDSENPFVLEKRRALRESEANDGVWSVNEIVASDTRERKQILAKVLASLIKNNTNYDCLLAKSKIFDEKSSFSLRRGAPHDFHNIRRKYSRSSRKKPSR